MITKMVVRNFKRFDEVEIEFGSPVVFIGPNNSGKTTALQALTLWCIGVKKWIERRGVRELPEKRPGVTINKKDIFSMPVPDANNLWRDMHVRNVKTVDGKKSTTNIRIEIIVSGVTDESNWECGLEFDYANQESFYCRPLRAIGPNGEVQRVSIPDAAANVQVAFLQPMSGLASVERKLEYGAISVLVGEGRTAEVLRNLCHIVHENGSAWDSLCSRMQKLFGVTILPPEYITARGEFVQRYVERDIPMDIALSGRGLQQTLLLLAYIYSNNNSVLLLDEPDAHLEFLRQRQIYQTITDASLETNSQIVIASHSEVILNEAIERDVVVGFIGKPHRVNERRSEVLKALKEIGFEHYFQAEQKGWVLYLEGSTDLAILREFAQVLNHTAAQDALLMPYVHYVANNVPLVQSHYHGLKEAVPHLRALAIFDRPERPLPDWFRNIGHIVWQKREIESYFCFEQALIGYATHANIQANNGPLLNYIEREANVSAMSESIVSISDALARLGRGSPWDGESKVSDEFLDPLFREYFRRLGIYNVMAKKNFSELVRYLPPVLISQEIIAALDAIASVSSDLPNQA